MIAHTPRSGRRVSWIAALVVASSAAVSFAAPSRAETFDCVMEPAQKLKLGTSVTGVLAEVDVQRGDKVKAGQVVAKLDTTVEQANLELAQAQANSVENIEAQRAKLDLAKKKLDRATPLAQKDIVSQDKLEGLQADYEIARRDLNAEVLKRGLAGIEAKRATASLNLRVVRSPITGVVMDKHLSVGEFVNQEAYIMTLAQLNPLYVEAYVPVSYYGQLSVGTVGVVHPAEPIGGSYKAPITVVDRVFDAASGTFGIRLELQNEKNILPAGERCRVDFDLSGAPVASIVGPQDRVRSSQAK